MARLVTDACKAEANSRLVVLRLATLILRMRAGWAELFGDLDTAAIALAVASIHADRLLRAEDLSPEVRNLENPLPEHLYGRCNIASVAVAAGLNRETARRKISKLESAGIVIREGADVRLAAGFTQREDLIRLVGAQLECLRRTADELLRDGVIVHQVEGP
jgi:hypothetical protein